MIASPEEVLLVLRAQNGDRDAFEALLRKLHGPVRGYLSGLLGASVADDAVQDTFLQVYRKLRLLREPAVFRAWTYRIASRVGIVHLKRERKWLELDRDSEVLDAIEEKSSAFGNLIGESRFTELIAQVTPASRAILLLHYQQDLTLDEVAAVLGIPPGTVKSRLQYGLTTLRKNLQEK